MLRDRVHLLELPLGADRTVNAVLVDGDPLTLVDTGIRSPDSLAALEAGLAAHGRRVEDLEQIVITHPHNDHFGAAGELVRRSGACLVGDGVAVMAEFPDSFLPNTRFRVGLFEEAGAPELAGRWRERFAGLAATAEAVQAEREIGEGVVVRMGGADWIALSTPGHAASSISLYQPDARLLISGDILLGNGGSNVTLHATERPARWLLEIVASLERLSLLDVDVAFPGHGPAVEDAKRAIADRRARALQRLERVAELSRGQRRHAAELSRALYPPRVGEGYLGVSQAIGYLEALRALGRAESELVNGIREYWS